MSAAPAAPHGPCPGSRSSGAGHSGDPQQNPPQLKGRNPQNFGDLGKMLLLAQGGLRAGCVLYYYYYYYWLFYCCLPFVFPLRQRFLLSASPAPGPLRLCPPPRTPPPLARQKPCPGDSRDLLEVRFRLGWKNNPQIASGLGRFVLDALPWCWNVEMSRAGISPKYLSFQVKRTHFVFSIRGHWA